MREVSGDIETSGERADTAEEVSLVDAVERRRWGLTLRATGWEGLDKRCLLSSGRDETSSSADEEFLDLFPFDEEEGKNEEKLTNPDALLADED